MKRLLLAFFVAATTVETPALPGLTLDEALAQTLQKNPAIQESKAALEQAAGQRLIFRSVALPRAGTGIIAGVQGGQRAGESATQPFVFATGSFLQPIFNAAIPASYRRGEIEILIAEQQLNVTVVEQLLKARVAFYTALYNRSLEAFGQSQRKRLDENLAGEQARYEAGNIERGALSAATLQARELDPQIEDAHRAYGGAILQLAEAMGNHLRPGATLPSPEGDLRFAQTNLIPEREIAAALKQRSDLRLARLLVRAAQEDLRIIEAGYYPAMNLVASGEYIPVTDIHRGSEGSPRRSDDIVSSEARLGPAYTWRVIDNGKVTGAALRQHAVREINELQLRKLEENVPQELVRLQNNLRAIAARHQSLSLAAEAAEKNVASVQESREQGLASQLEFRTAETSLLATRSGILSAVYEQEIALADLDRVTGRYFQFSEDTTGKLR